MPKRDYKTKKYNTPRTQTKDKKKTRQGSGRRTTLVVVFVLLLTVGVGLTSDVITVREVTISGSNDPEVSLVAQQWLSNHTGPKILSIFPRNHMLFIPTNDLEDALLQFSFVSNVAFIKRPPETIEIHITEQKPNMVIHEDNLFMVVGESGAIIEQSRELVRFDLPLIVGTSTSELVDDETKVSNVPIYKTEFISDVYTEFPRYFNDVTIDHFQLIDGNTDMRIYTSGGWYGLFNTQGDFLVQLSNLYRVYDEKVPTDKKKTLEYIDVRLANYVYFK